MKKIILLLASYILCLDSVFSQEIEWQNTIGGSEADYLYSIKQTNDGGYILGGFSHSGISGDKTENNRDVTLTTPDYWVIKLDWTGNIQWQKTIGGSNTDRLWSVSQTTDGGYICGGMSNSNISGDKTENSMGGDDYWVIKLDAVGNLQWQNTIGGNSLEYLFSVFQTSDGGYICGGESMSGISGDKTDFNMGSSDYWVVKLDSSGNIQWQNAIGGNDADHLYSLSMTTDGGYICGGLSWSDSSGDKSENNLGVFSYWVVKIDSVGSIQWENTIGGNVADDLESIVQTTDGGYVCGGFSNSQISGDKTESCWGGFDYWVVKLDSSGNVQWENTIGGTSKDEMYSMVQTADGGYLCGGGSWSNINGDKTENNWDTLTAFAYDNWLVKLDASGNVQWQNTIGGVNDDLLRSISLAADGEYICGGYSNSNISGDKTENSNGNYDYWIIKITEKYNFIKGKLFIDGNNNSVQDTGEPAVSNKKIVEINNEGFAFSKPGGEYILLVADSGNFTVSSLLNYYNAVPLNQSAYFPGFYLTDSLNDFAFQPTGVFNDLCMTITPIGNFRAGMNASYMINYENIGTTTLNGTVIFFPDNDVTYFSSNVTPTSVTTDSVVWNAGTLSPFQTGSILVTVNVDIGAPIGTLINSNVRIEPVAGDNYPGCNYAYWEILTVGSYDPNEILVDKDTVFTTQLSSPPYLDYIIYFQNTGNDTAFNVKVLNPIDTFKLQLNTFEFVASSNPMNITYKPWERNFEFMFDNILLPDSNVNEPASHGFIRYRIKPKTTLVAGDSINSTAYIYFDFNAPVQTNTAVTEIVLPTGSPTLALPGGEGIALAPNPATDELTISVKPPHRGGLVGLHIFDLFGREVFQSSPDSYRDQSSIKINVSRFSQGVYFIEMRSGEQVLRGKFLKE